MVSRKIINGKHAFHAANVPRDGQGQQVVVPRVRPYPRVVHAAPCVEVPLTEDELQFLLALLRYRGVCPLRCGSRYRLS